MLAPGGRDAVVYVATPEEFNVAVPNVVVPARNVTVPAGASVPADVTVAARLRLCPGFTVADEVLRVVTVEAAVTVSVPATSVKL